MREALARGTPIDVTDLQRPGASCPLRVRQVPPPVPRPGFLTHARFRRTSPITQYAAAAAIEAVGEDAEKVKAGALRLGIILCVMTGCVNYSRRFYDETLKEPATASPLVFPETVFNAPASHIAALLETTAVCYTLVGDPGTFLQGLAMSAEWLMNNRVDGCLVIGAEELDWLTADTFRLFAKTIVLSAGAGALYLRRQSSSPVVLRCVTNAHTFIDRPQQLDAARRARAELASSRADDLLCDGLQGIRTMDRAEVEAWRDRSGSRTSPKKILGEGLAAASAWQCVAGVDALCQRRFQAATISVVGCNEQAIGARFEIAGGIGRG